MPSGIIRFESIAPARIEAASGEGESAKPGSLSILAYNGGELRVPGYEVPVYVDLDGLKGIDGEKLPVLRNHDKERPVGVVQASREENTITAEGKLTGNSDDRYEVEAMAADGYEWQASIGAHPIKSERVRRGATTEVNGQLVVGPAIIARQSRLREVTLCTLGADALTQVAIAAEMEDESCELSESSLTSIKAEKARRDAIEASAVCLIRKGGPMDEIEAAAKEAIADPTVSLMKFENDLLRKYTFTSTPIRAGASRELSGEMQERALEAAVLRDSGWSASALEAEYDDRTLNAMDRDNVLKHNFGLKDLFIYAAEANGQRVSRGDIEGMLSAALPPINAAGSSTFSLSGVLSNIANKTIKQQFMSVTDLKPISGNGGVQAWSVLGSTGSVSDFKERTCYSLTGDMTYEEVGKDGELKHGSLGEEQYTNQASTYGKIAEITRKDIINDDLNAFGQIGRRLGRGAALKLAEEFWKAFLASSLFSTSAVTTAGAEFKPNLFEGASTNLQISSLTTAEKMFIEQVDPDGKPLGVMPEILLVPPGEMSNAAVLMNSQLIVSGSSSKQPNQNPHAGKYAGYTSPYMSNTAYTGASSLAWYLLADPQTLPIIETVFLNGRQQPTIENTQADFNILGVRFRGYHDFGVSVQEKRGAVKSKGEA